MTRSTSLIHASLALAFGAVSAMAQGLQMTIRPDSKLTLEGSSNVHDWACRTTAFVATVEVDTAFVTRPLTQVARPINRVSVSIPVRTLKCGHGKMDDNMYKALKADQYPEIRYELTTYTVDREQATADSFVANTSGQLTVSGRTIAVDIPVTAERLVGGAARGQGAVGLRMTDFGITPPTALLGTLRTRNEITIAFQVLLDRSVLVALSQQP